MFARRTDWALSPNAFSKAVEEFRASPKCKELIDLSASNPTLVGLKCESSRILEALHDPLALKYQPHSTGLLTARKAIASYYAGHGSSVDVSGNVVLTTSTSEAYSFIFRLLCEPGDEVLVPHPGYPLFEFLAGLNDVALVPYSLRPEEDWRVDLDSVKRGVSGRTRALVVVHPNNPTGSFVGMEEARALNQLCADNVLALVADEVFLDYKHTAERVSSFCSNDSALTFVLSGISKISCLPQMKLAWIVANGPRELVSDAVARLEVIADTYLSVSTPMQLALPELLSLRNGVQLQLMGRIKENLHELDRQISRHSVCNCLPIAGGWYAVLRVPAIQSDEALAIRLLRECSVLLHPGHFYDFASEGFLVLSLIPPPQKFAEGVRRALAKISEIAG